MRYYVGIFDISILLGTTFATFILALYIRYTYTTLGMVRILYYIERRYIMILMLGLVLGLTNFVLAFLCSLPVLCLPFLASTRQAQRRQAHFIPAIFNIRLSTTDILPTIIMVFVVVCGLLPLVFALSSTKLSIFTLVDLVLLATCSYFLLSHLEDVKSTNLREVN